MRISYMPPQESDGDRASNMLKLQADGIEDVKFIESCHKDARDFLDLQRQREADKNKPQPQPAAAAKSDRQDSSLSQAFTPEQVQKLKTMLYLFDTHRLASDEGLIKQPSPANPLPGEQPV